MKKNIAMLLAVICVMAFTGCSQTQNSNTPVSFEEKTALIPMIMVNETLYLDTGYNSKLTQRCGTMDGVITSAVEAHQKPGVNNQSNFGTDYGYQYGEEGTVEVYMDGTWRIFATDIVRNTMQTGGNFKQPPALTVVCGENAVTALTGTASWSYLHEDGTARHLEFDSLHPLQAKEHMPVLNVLPAAKSSDEPGKAYLLWGITPTKVTVRCWSEACWGQPNAQSEPVPVTDGPDFTIQLKDGNYIYEVVGEWAFPEARGGRACFSFCTNTPPLEPTIIN